MIFVLITNHYSSLSFNSWHRSTTRGDIIILGSATLLSLYYKEELLMAADFTLKCTCFNGNTEFMNKDMIVRICCTYALYISLM